MGACALYIWIKGERWYVVNWTTEGVHLSPHIEHAYVYDPLSEIYRETWSTLGAEVRPL